MAHNQNRKANDEQQKANSNHKPIPPTHVFIEPSPAIDNLKPEAKDQKQASEEKALPRFARPEWVIVYITTVYVFISGWTLIAVYRQARGAKKQAKLMGNQLVEMSRQTDWLIEKERPRLSIELDRFDPRPTPTGEYCVTGSVSIYGHTIAKIRTAKICVSTDPCVIDYAFNPSMQEKNSPSRQWLPEEMIELPRVIHPNSYDTRFTATVYSAPWKAASAADIRAFFEWFKSKSGLKAGSTEGLRVTPIPKFLNSYILYCQARIEYFAANTSWTENLKMRFWVLGDPNSTSEYGWWEDYDTE